MTSDVAKKDQILRHLSVLLDEYILFLIQIKLQNCFNVHYISISDAENKFD